MCVLCVQDIADRQSELLDPSISEGQRALLEDSVQVLKGFIQDNNASIAQLNSEMAELMEEGSPSPAMVSWQVAMPMAANDGSTCYHGYL